jgi:hypothetical protein
MMDSTNSLIEDDTFDNLRSPIEGRRREGAELVINIVYIQTQLSAAKTVEQLADIVIALI